MITYLGASIWLRDTVYIAQVDHPLYFIDGSAPVHSLCDVIQKVLRLGIDQRWHRRRTLSDVVHVEPADIPGSEPVTTEGTSTLHPVEASSSFLSFWFYLLRYILGHLRSTKDVTASNGVGNACFTHVVLHAYIARRVGIDYQHDRQGEEDSTLEAEDRGQRNIKLWALGWVSRADR